MSKGVQSDSIIRVGTYKGLSKDYFLETCLAQVCICVSVSILHFCTLLVVVGGKEMILKHTWSVRYSIKVPIVDGHLQICSLKNLLH